MAGLRDLIREASPPWLRRTWGERLLYAPGLILDGVMHWALEGIKARFPSKTPEEALRLIGADRRIVRGFDESPDLFRIRLRRWLDDWRIAGNPYALMEQIRAYLTGYAVRVRCVNTKGTWFTIEADGSYTIDRKKGNWDWDGGAASWSRFWVIIYPLSTGLWPQEGTWGSGGTWGDNGLTIGTAATSNQVATIRQLVRDWKPAGTRCQWIIVASDANSFSPAAGAGPPMPDGQWGYGSKNSAGTQVESRLATARYWEGTS